MRIDMTIPELARTLAASVKQRIACGERTGQKVLRIGSGFGDEGERPALTGPRCASVNGFSLHAKTANPTHRRAQLKRFSQLSRIDGPEVVAPGETLVGPLRIYPARHVQATL